MVLKEKWCINFLVRWERLKRTAVLVQGFQLNFVHWIWYWFHCKTFHLLLSLSGANKDSQKLQWQAARPLIFGKGLLIDNCLINARRIFAYFLNWYLLKCWFFLGTLSIICLVCIGFVNQILTGLTQWWPCIVFQYIVAFNSMSHVYVWTMRYESEWRGFVWTIDLLRVCNQTVKQEGFRDFSPSKFVWSYLSHLTVYSNQNLISNNGLI